MFRRLHEALLARLREAGCVDVDDVAADSASVRAVFGGADRPEPTDRGEAGTNHHLATDANRHDVTQLLPPVEAMGRVPCGGWRSGRRAGCTRPADCA